MTTYPYTIDSRAGERITFVRRVDGAPDRLEVENEVDPGKGPPMHAHPSQAEALTVVEGRIGYQILGEEPCYAGVGETVRFDAGVAHRFWNAGETPLRCSGWISPALRSEEFLSALYRTLAEGKARPSVFDMAFLLHRFAPETELVSIPSPVRRVVFPLVRMLGRVTGRYRKFTDDAR